MEFSTVSAVSNDFLSFFEMGCRYVKYESTFFCVLLVRGDGCCSILTS